MRLRSATPPAWTVDVESTVRDHLYGERHEVTATPIRRGAPTTLAARYRLHERLASGGTADVFRARDERLQRDVAVKVIAGWLAGDAATVRRFRREAEFCARLAHRNVAAVLDAGSRPREYLVMELVDGQNAATLLQRDEPVATAQAVDVVVQMCDALGHAHDRGVIHGDIAPRNILVDPRGTAKLVDFGLAVDRFGPRPDGDLMGTPGYVAPEIIRYAVPSPQSDLYALGVVAYRLLGGPPLFRRSDAEETAARPSAIASVPSLAEVRPDLPPALTATVDAAMAKEHRSRPASAAELRERLLETRTGLAQLQAA
jgi:eukaryotic-like serine/threonine-protein kinase